MTKKTKLPNTATLRGATLKPKLSPDLRVDPTLLRGVELRRPGSPAGSRPGPSSVGAPLELGVWGDVTLDFKVALDASGACTGLWLEAIGGESPEGPLAGDLRGQSLMYRARPASEASLCFRRAPMALRASSSVPRDLISHTGNDAVVRSRCDGLEHRLEITVGAAADGSSGGTATVIILETEPVNDNQRPELPPEPEPEPEPS